jgi:hypothetical protein
MDPILAEDENIRNRIKKEWAKWRSHKSFDPDVLSWWEQHVKTPQAHL